MLFHHDPYHTDDDLDALLTDTRHAVKGTPDWVTLAYEGMEIEYRAAGLPEVRAAEPA